MLNDCSGKIALITGAGTGIGRSCAKALAEAGAVVVVSDIDAGSAAETAALISKNGGKARGLGQDVTDEGVWEEVITGIADEEGGLNVLVNNAGIAIGVAVTEMSLADWQRQNAVNLDGVFLGTKHAIPLMAQSGGGSIINISSVAGLIGAGGLAGYCATKGGVRLFTKAVAIECAAGDTNIRVNSVHPGIIDTDIWGKEISGIAQGQPELMVEGANRINIEAFTDTLVPGGRVGRPEEVAQGVVFLASDASSYMSGTELVIDHAQTAG
ncbi:MAG: SDR family NAD(P)-dependent oxidoreductase [Pseudomonadota bacterium]|nr:SDR family NAD(P)-dependent oxidoreductase [Pseudomonadota bacterium]